MWFSQGVDKSPKVGNSILFRQNSNHLKYLLKDEFPLHPDMDGRAIQVSKMIEFTDHCVFWSLFYFLDFMLQSLSLAKFS